MESLTRDQLNAVFEKVVETCEKKLYDPKLNGVDWRQIAEGRKERILAGTDLRLPREAMSAVVTELAREGAVVKDGAAVRLPSHLPKLTAAIKLGNFLKTV